MVSGKCHLNTNTAIGDEDILLLVTFCITFQDWLVQTIFNGYKFNCGASCQVACSFCVPGFLWCNVIQYVHLLHYLIRTLLYNLSLQMMFKKRSVNSKYCIHGPITWFLETTRSGTKMGHRPTSDGSPRDRVSMCIHDYRSQDS